MNEYLGRSLGGLSKLPANGKGVDHEPDKRSHHLASQQAETHCVVVAALAPGEQLVVRRLFALRIDVVGGLRERVRGSPQAGLELSGGLVVFGVAVHGDSQRQEVGVAGEGFEHVLVEGLVEVLGKLGHLLGDTTEN